MSAGEQVSSVDGDVVEDEHQLASCNRHVTMPELSIWEALNCSNFAGLERSDTRRSQVALPRSEPCLSQYLIMQGTTFLPFHDMRV